VSAWTAVGVPPVEVWTLYSVFDTRSLMKAMESSPSMSPSASSSYWMASPTPTLVGRTDAKVAVVPTMLISLELPVVMADVAEGPTDL